MAAIQEEDNFGIREAWDNLRSHVPSIVPLPLCQTPPPQGYLTEPPRTVDLATQGFSDIGGPPGLDKGPFYGPSGQLIYPGTLEFEQLNDPSQIHLLFNDSDTVDLATQGFSDIVDLPGLYDSRDGRPRDPNLPPMNPEVLAALGPPGLYDSRDGRPSVLQDSYPPSPLEMSPSSPPRTSPPMAEPVEGGWFQQFFGNDQAPPPQQTTMSPSPTQTAPAPNWQRPSALTRFNRPLQRGGRLFKDGGETQRPAPGLLQENPQRTVTMEEVIRDLMGSLGLSRDEALKHLQDRYKNGGSVRGRRDALPMVEGDHVVPAHAVKGNEGGLAALSKKLMGNQSYDGMIRGPGGPREDAIKTRVYAAGGGISGKMDNLQNPFNSVPARVSDKEYVIPRQAITNLGMMNGAREGDANKAGQDIIYQLVENLKRKA